jgi:hypothetical protein
MHGFAKVATRFPSPMGNSISVPSVAGQPHSRRFRGEDEPVSGSQQVRSRGLDQGQEPGQPGDGETSGGALVTGCLPTKIAPTDRAGARF